MHEQRPQAADHRNRAEDWTRVHFPSCLAALHQLFAPMHMAATSGREKTAGCRLQTEGTGAKGTEFSTYFFEFFVRSE